MKIDWTGGVWSALTVLVLIGGLAVATHDNPVPGLVADSAGRIVGGLADPRERSREPPVMPVDLLAMPVIGLSALAAIGAFIASAMLMVALPFRFEQGMGYTPRPSACCCCRSR